jgi:hypothetical protein
MDIYYSNISINTQKWTYIRLQTVILTFTKLQILVLVFIELFDNKNV